MTVTRDDLAVVASTAAPTSVMYREAREFVDQLLEEMSRAIVQDGRLVIGKFGVFNVRQKAARMARNPRRPSEPHEIPAHRALSFKPARELRASVNSANTRP